MSNKRPIQPTSDQNRARGSGHLTGENAEGVTAIISDKGKQEVENALYNELIKKAEALEGVHRLGGTAFPQAQLTASTEIEQTPTAG